MRKVFFIRGFKLGTTGADDDFEEFRTVIQKIGYEVIGVPFTWDHTTMSQYCDKFVAFYNEYRGAENIILGHSFGAMVALITSTATKPDLLILCSLSAYFQEDLPKYPKSDWITRRLGIKRTRDMQNISAISTAKKVRDSGIKTAMLYGSKEKELFPQLYSRIQETAAILKPPTLIAVPEADHSIRGETYVEAIKSVLKDKA